MHKERIIILVVAAMLYAAGYTTARLTEQPCAVTAASVSVTETIRDTVKKPVPAPQIEVAIRTETAKLKIKPAAASNAEQAIPSTVNDQTLNSAPASEYADVEIPITRKTYTTPEYRAVVSGFRPSLDSIEVYRDTRITTHTITKVLPAPKKWLALTVGPQVGVGTNGQIVPAIGASLGIIILSK